MKINPVRNEQSRSQAKEIAKTSAQVGATATALTVLLARNEIMPALKNTIAGKDRFVSKAKDAAVKTMEKTGKTFDLNKIAAGLTAAKVIMDKTIGKQDKQ